MFLSVDLQYFLDLRLGDEKVKLISKVNQQSVLNL